jgi:hypothetical protein
VGRQWPSSADTSVTERSSAQARMIATSVPGPVRSSSAALALQGLPCVIGHTVGSASDSP